MNDYQHSLDHDYLSNNQEDQLERYWSILVLVGVMLKAMYVLSFLADLGLYHEIYPFANSFFSLVYAYLLWYIMQVCNRCFKVRSVNLPIWIIVALSLIRSVLYLFTKVINEMDSLGHYWKIFSGINICIVICIAWLLIVLFRLPPNLLRKYMRYWTYAIFLNSISGFLLFFSYLFSDLEDTLLKTQLQNFLWLIPDLILVWMVLKESQMGVVINQAVQD